MAARLNDKNIPREVEAELENCPFCDSTASLVSECKIAYSPMGKSYPANFHYVRCPCCKSRGREYEKKEDAIWAWNLRKYTEMEVKRYAKEIRHAINSGRSYRFKRKAEPRENS